MPGYELKPHTAWQMPTTNAYVQHELYSSGGSGGAGGATTSMEVIPYREGFNTSMQYVEGVKVTTEVETIGDISNMTVSEYSVWLRQYQKQHNLVADGIFGAQTEAAMNNLLCVSCGTSRDVEYFRINSQSWTLCPKCQIAWTAGPKIHHTNYWDARKSFLSSTGDVGFDRTKLEAMLACVTETSPDLNQVVAEPWPGDKVKTERRGTGIPYVNERTGTLAAGAAYIVFMVLGMIVPALFAGVVMGVLLTLTLMWRKDGR